MMHTHESSTTEIRRYHFNKISQSKQKSCVQAFAIISLINEVFISVHNSICVFSLGLLLASRLAKGRQMSNQKEKRSDKIYSASIHSILIHPRSTLNAEEPFEFVNFCDSFLPLSLSLSLENGTIMMCTSDKFSNYSF